MREVVVEASKKYSVYIGKKLLDSCGERIRNCVGGKKVMLVTDDTVNCLYADTVERSMSEGGYDICKFVMKSGEASKNAANFIELLNELAKARLTRTDVIAALGGGVVGDLAGFAAATYLRGIRFVQLPTTLLAAVDSSVGGKTAIDLEAGKNLAGAFYQPDMVICDVDTLSTLSQKIFSDGCAEVIKYGILEDRQIIEKLIKLTAGLVVYQKINTADEVCTGLDNSEEKEQLGDIIESCVKIKRDIVMQDEYDTGKRQLLNLGHTIGHAIEACSGYSITHGSAVAIGMVYVMRASVNQGMCSETELNRLLEILNILKLPCTTPYNAAELYNVMTSDKKRSGDKINIIIPERIGKCSIVNIGLEELRSILM